MIRWLSALALLLPLSCACAQALLDPGFGSGGRVTVRFDESGTSLDDQGVAILRGPADEWYLVGSVDVADANPAVVGIGLARRLPNGGADNTFGGSGTGQRVKNAALTSVTDAALDDAQVLVVGGFGNDSAMVRFHASGIDDTGFAGDGGVTWDASGLGEADSPQAVIELSGRYFVAGRFDAAAGTGVDHDVYAALVAENGSSVDVFLREELGGSDADGDRVVDLEQGDEGDFASAGSFVLLADNDSPDYAGTVMVLDTATQARLETIRLDGVLLPNATGCNSQLVDAYSTDLVRMDERRVAVVGNLMAGFATPGQVYVIVIDILDAEIEGVRCSVQSQANYATDGRFAYFDDGWPVLHLAMSIAGRAGYWRWAYDEGANGLVWRPDPTIHGGSAVTVEFPNQAGAAAVGSATSIELDDEERPVVLGSRLWRIATGVFDQDFALFRIHKSATVLRDGFEEPVF